MLVGRILSKLFRATISSCIALACTGYGSAVASDGLARVIADAQPKMVKIHGAGGVRGLEAYQSGFLISADGHVLTVWSYVLDTDHLSVTLDDGRKFQAEVVNADPALELAVLKIDATDAAHFELAASVPAHVGSRVLAFSNLFGVATGEEPTSVQHGVLAAKTRLDARRGTFETPYHGAVYVLDAMTNNPGAAGGALLNQNGELLGMLGKELRSSQNNIWLNYAIPIHELRSTAERILEGKFERAREVPPLAASEAASLPLIGVVLVPEVLERTPPYVDRVLASSPAAAAGVRPDDLIVFVGGTLVQSSKGLREELARTERDAPIKLMLLRGQELVEVVLQPREAPTP